MTSEELKQQYTMRDVVERYGFRPDRAGFIHCPFHNGDNGASMKIYEKDFHCFGCGANGDIFDFVQKMDRISFREAFLVLGGTYEERKNLAFSARAARYRAQKAKERREKEAFRAEQQRGLNQRLISIYRKALLESVPMSDAWCDAYNALQIQLYIHGELNGLPY